MSSVKVSVEISAPRQQVFEVFTDLDNAADRIEGIKSLTVLTDGPVAVGTRFTETRVMFGKEATETMEFTEVTPPSQYVVEANSHGSHYKSVYGFEEIAGGTKVTMSFMATPQSVFAKIMWFLMGKAMMKASRKCLADDMTDLKKFIEEGAEGTPTSP